MLLCSVVFARWLPTGAPSSDIPAAVVQNNMFLRKAAPVQVSMRPGPSLTLTGTR